MSWNRKRTRITQVTRITRATREAVSRKETCVSTEKNGNRKIVHSKLFHSLLIIAICAVFLSVVFYCIFRFSSFDELETFCTRRWSTTYYDRNGNLLQVTSLENGVRREYTSLDEIPEAVVKAFIASEDSRFFYHHGVDYLSVVRAAFQNVTQQRQVSGASTITMQLARMIAPSDIRNFSAKFHDVWNAWRLEARFSKDDILELYLNSIPFGYNVEGITTAARFFFGSKLDDLTIEQTVCLAVILRRPSLYNPFDHATDCATAAFRLYNTLDIKTAPEQNLPANNGEASFGVDETQLADETSYGVDETQFAGGTSFGVDETQFAGEASFGAVEAQPTDDSAYTRILASAQSASRFSWQLNTPHLIRYLDNSTSEVQLTPTQTAITQTASTHQVATQPVVTQQAKGGVVNLSVDLNLQRFCEFMVSDALKNSTTSRIDNAAVIVIENKTGEVLSWVGSNDWFDDENGGQIDGVLTPNQPGSSMKPFLYALALENGYNPTDVLSDVPMEFGGANLYIPMNFNNRFNGPVLFRISLASSLNVPAVYLLSKLGVARYLDYLENLGFKSLTGVNHQIGENADLGLALGAGEVSLAELACAFSVFPRDGVFLPLCFYKSKLENGIDKGSDIETSTEATIQYNFSQNTQQVFTSDTARIICDILSDKSARVTGFGYTQTFETDYPSIFKTGTANQYQSIVALGATVDYTVGVWMGNFSGNTIKIIIQ